MVSTRNKSAGCCCGEEACFFEYIPCCIHPLSLRLDWNVTLLTGGFTPIMIDRRVIARLVVGDQPVDSDNIALFSSLQGEREYESGFNVWDWGHDISMSLFTPSLVTPYNGLFTFTVKYCGDLSEDPGSLAQLELISRFDPQIINSTNIAPPWPVIGFFTDSVGDWTIEDQPNFKATSRPMGVGEELEINLQLGYSDYRKIFDLGSPGPCPPRNKFKDDDDECWMRLTGSDQTVGELVSGAVIPNCLEEVECGCYCREDPAYMCDCRLDTTAFNTERAGQHRWELLPIEHPDPSASFTLSFEFMPDSNGVFNDLFWYGRCAQIGMILGIGYNPLNQRLTCNLNFTNTNDNPVTIGAWGTLVGFFPWNADNWNTIEVDWALNGANGTLTLTVNGVSAQISTTQFKSVITGDLSVLAGNVVIGHGNALADLPSEGCFRNYQLTTP